VLLLGLGDETVALPISKVERIVEIPGDAIEASGREEFALLDDDPVPVLGLAKRLSLPSSELQADRPVTLVLTEVRGERLALRVDRVSGQQQIYVKPVPELLSSVRALAGLTILGDGRPVFVLDTNQMV
jgi:two-component system chemotaxis sensor kinase CheA